MTREEAIEEIKKVRFNLNYQLNGTSQFEEAFDIAINALEQQPRRDCVSRRAVLEVIRKCHCEEWVKADIGAPIEALSSVNPQPRIGHWIEKQEEDDCEPFILWECSNCHNTVLRGHFRQYSYCPNCGARMTKPHESEVNNG